VGNYKKVLFVFSMVLMLFSCLRHNVVWPTEDRTAEPGSRSYTPNQERLVNTEIETATFALG
jgi:hypothetical protein